tara:strand:+ start:68484 stop:69272 length:789 start_codon:yes stop_codon:yes gene_type:complete
MAPGTYRAFANQKQQNSQEKVVDDLSNLNKIPACLFILCFALGSGLASAQRGPGLSTDFPDSRTLAVQSKVNDLFEAGDYERAYFIYRNELAPLGDKYAQYMVGYMYLTGKGVFENNVAALAWYRLAAERGTEEFVAVSNRLASDMSDEEVRRAEQMYAELRAEYSDLAVLMASIKKDSNQLEPRTGTRISRGSSSLVKVYDPRTGRSITASEYDRRVRTLLEKRLTMLKELGDFEDLETDPDKVDLAELERRVQERLRFGD